MMCRVRSQRGATTSAFVAALLPALIILTGLVVDGAQHVRHERQLQTSAAAAARAGTDELAHTRVHGGRDVRAAVAAAQSRLRADGHAGTVSVRGGELQVHLTGTTETVFLSLIGITHIDAAATARSRLVLG